MNPTPKKRLGAVGAAIGAVLAIFVVWQLLHLGRVENRVRKEEVEMFDISQPPPPPPPPPPQIEQQIAEAKPAEQPQAVQPDPLSAVQPQSANPPAGDLASLLQDPTASASPFAGGPRGQGGTGKGPLIGGVATGSGASRAYADTIKNAVMRHLRRDKSLAQEAFSFSIKVRVNASSALEVVEVSNVTPPALASAINEALRGLSSVGSPPPAGGPIPYVATIRLNQS